MTPKRKKRATASQISIASLYGIPLHQAHTVNGDKVQKYLQYLASPLVRLEHWLNAQERKRMLIGMMEEYIDG
jgi:hypothetical protein